MTGNNHTRFADLESVQATIRARYLAGDATTRLGRLPTLYDWEVLTAIQRAGVSLVDHRVSYGGFVMRVQTTATGLPVNIDHYSGRGRKRGDLVITTAESAYSPVQFDGVGAVYTEDSYPTGGDKFKAASRAVLAEFWQGGDLVAIYERLGQRAGRCCICGACLTVQESIARGNRPRMHQEALGSRLLQAMPGCGASPGRLAETRRGNAGRITASMEVLTMTPENTMTLPQRLHAWRKASGLSTPQAGKLAGRNQSYICALENGRSRPSGETLVRLAGAYGCTVEQLTAGEPELAASVAAYRDTARERAMLDRIALLETQLSIALSAVDTVAAENSHTQAKLENVRADLERIRESAWENLDDPALDESCGFGAALDGQQLENRITELLGTGPLGFDALAAETGADDYVLRLRLDDLRAAGVLDICADAYMLCDVPADVRSLRNCAIRRDGQGRETAASREWRYRVTPALAARNRNTDAGNRYWQAAYGGRA